MIIACHNEARSIERKLTNTLALACPEPFEVVVVDDHSTDETLQCVDRFLRAWRPPASGRSVKVLINRYAAGKNGALLTAFENAAGTVYLVTDADIELGPSTLEDAWSWFERTPRLGGLCLTPRLRSNDTTMLKKYAAHYEPFNRRLKMLQSGLDSVPTLHGQAMFIRAACGVVPTADLPGDDVDFAIQIRRAGYRVQYAADLPFFEEVAADSRQLDRQKIRRAKAVMRSLWHHRGVLLNPRYGAFGLICYPLDFVLYFGLVPVLVCIGAAAVWLVAIAPLAGAASIAGAIALTLVPAIRQVLLYGNLLVRAQFELWREQVPRLRWLPHRS